MNISHISIHKETSQNCTDETIKNFYITLKITLFLSSPGQEEQRGYRRRDFLSHSLCFHFFLKDKGHQVYKKCISLAVLPPASCLKGLKLSWRERETRANTELRSKLQLTSTDDVRTRRVTRLYAHIFPLQRNKVLVT